MALLEWHLHSYNHFVPTTVDSQANVCVENIARQTYEGLYAFPTTARLQVQAGVGIKKAFSHAAHSAIFTNFADTWPSA